MAATLIHALPNSRPSDTEEKVTDQRQMLSDLISRSCDTDYLPQPFEPQQISLWKCDHSLSPIITSN